MRTANKKIQLVIEK